ncbi:MAG: hypothetical protein ACJ79R_00975 [Anaeromyxobacteraceae bacterium]
MNTTLSVHEFAATLPIAVNEEDVARVREALAARATAARPAEVTAASAVALDDGGVAFGLDPADDFAPHWGAWMAWVDSHEGYRLSAPKK